MVTFFRLCAILILYPWFLSNFLAHSNCQKKKSDAYIDGEEGIKLLSRGTLLVNNKSSDESSIFFLQIIFFIHLYKFPHLHEYKLKDSSLGQKPVLYIWNYNYPSNDLQMTLIHSNTGKIMVYGLHRH